MIKSGCENVCPALRPSSSNSRHLNITSSVISRTRCSNRGRTWWVSQSLRALRQDVRVDESAGYDSSTSRTGIRVRFDSISISRDGEACIAATSIAPVTSPLRRRNSSSARMTPPSLPCTVTCDFVGSLITLTRYHNILILILDATQQVGQARSRGSPSSPSIPESRPRPTRGRCRSFDSRRTAR